MVEGNAARIRTPVCLSCSTQVLGVWLRHCIPKIQGKKTPRDAGICATRHSVGVGYVSVFFSGVGPLLQDTSSRAGIVPADGTVGTVCKWVSRLRRWTGVLLIVPPPGRLCSIAGRRPADLVDCRKSGFRRVFGQYFWLRCPGQHRGILHQECFSQW
jgi:hypothetical protein